MTDAADAPRRFLGWSAALAPRLADLARAYLPAPPVTPRHREHLMVAVAAALGCVPLQHLHRGWYDLLGPAELTEQDDDVEAWASAAVLEGPGEALAALPDGLPDAAVRALQALVAHTAASAAAVEAFEALAGQVRGRQRTDLTAIPAQVATTLAGGFLVLPTAVTGAMFGAVGRLVPSAPPVDVDEDPNLLVQLLAETLPTWLGSAWGRTVVAAVPVTVPIAVRAGLTGATVRIGRGRVSIANGLAADVWAVFDGEVDALVRAGSDNLSRELRADRLTR